ncbi:hypothetical protein L1049_003465 [Liquidambar formosana]|uniref:GATA transcription factor n=1 Tax=Liquidambar formosana TaxID=63359 RepID=A0AAP0N609_LIQFO
MECVEGALKGSFRKEMALKPTIQTAIDESSTVSGQSGASVVDDCFIDDLLDFSKMGGAEDGFLTQDHVKGEEAEEEEEEDDDDDKACASLSPQQEQTTTDQKSNPRGSFSLKDDFGASELSVPADDVADLEWLSHFVEDSFSEYSLPFPAGVLTAKPKNQPEKPAEPETESPTNPCFTTPFPAKARSKRTRTCGRGWPLGSPSLTESSSSSSSSYSSSSSTSPSTPLFFYNNPSLNLESFNYSVAKPPAKKQKKKHVGETGGGTQPPRRCSHCGVQKTPQWRTGPMGAKTLCNACGVRYKSGRLLPEYRPACSPTFSSEIHSNHHRKVLEMRKKKEIPPPPQSGLAPAVPSF